MGEEQTGTPQTVKVRAQGGEIQVISDPPGGGVYLTYEEIGPVGQIDKSLGPAGIAAVSDHPAGQTNANSQSWSSAPALIALSELALGGLCPSLPGRQPW
jgi:hypothetical protein